MPVLALWPELDRHFPVEHAQWLGRAVPGTEVTIVPGARHWMPFTHADELAARMLTFAGE